MIRAASRFSALLSWVLVLCWSLAWYAPAARAQITGPDVHIVKQDPDSAAPGGLVTYTITYGNNGPQDATGVRLTETVPNNTTFVAAQSSPGWNCPDGSAGGTVCDFSVGTLAASAVASLTFTVRVDTSLPAGVNEIANNATILDDGLQGSDRVPGNNVSAVATPITTLTPTPLPTLPISGPDVSVVMVKTPPGPVQPGGLITYVLTYNNLGTQPATGVVIGELVPNNTEFLAASSTAGWSCPDLSQETTPCNFNVGSVPAGGTGTVTFTVRVVSALPVGINEIANTATISHDGLSGPDTVLNNNVSTVLTPVVQPTPVPPTPEPQPTATRTPMPTREPEPEPTATSAPSATPGGAAGAPSATPAGTAGAPSATPDGAAGAPSATPDGAGATPSPGGNPLPTAVSDASATATAVAGAAQVANPVITKQANPTEARVGDLVEFTITVSNPGNITAEGVVISDDLPAFLELVEVSASRGDVLRSGNSVKVLIFELAPGDVVTVRLVARVVSEAQPPNNANVAVVSSTSPTDNQNDNSARAEVNVLPSGGPPAAPAAGPAASAPVAKPGPAAAPAPAAQPQSKASRLPITAENESVQTLQITRNEVLTMAAILALDAMIIGLLLRRSKLSIRR